MHIGPGQGRASLTGSHALRLGILRGLCSYLDRLTDPAGALVCPRHRVEHTGKVVYGALLHLVYGKLTREEEHLDLARRRVLRAVDQLGPDPSSGAPVFLPGRTDPRNASNHPIDGGACADVIATVLEEAPEVFGPSETERCRDALERHVEGYLRREARDRPVPAQRLWAGTGVARAARLLERTDWRSDALEGCARALDELAPDGGAPYIPAGSAECVHPGLADLSGFYHSRVPAFLLYIHAVLDEPLAGSAAGRLRACLDALLAMRDGQGRKVMLNEAKPWYWESDYEVASHPFDVYALHEGARALGVPLYAREAGRAMEEWIAHLDPLDGSVASHWGSGTNFQCRVFWTAHGAWVARVIGDVALRAPVREPMDFDLPSSGLVHVERGAYTAVLRGAHRGASNLYGCGVGGGQLQSFVPYRTAERRPLGERVTPARRGRQPEGSFLVHPRGGPTLLRRLRRAWTAQGSELRFRLYVASVEWKARAWWHALTYPWRHVVLRTLREASAWYGSHLDRASEHRLAGDELRFVGALANRDGERLAGSSTVRRYHFKEDGVWVEDTLRLEEVTGRVRYVLPRNLRDVELSCGGTAWRRRGRRLSARVRGDVVEMVVKGRWPAA